MVVVVGGGGALTVKLLEEVALPPGVVTLRGPFVAPAGTTAVSWLSESTVKLAASVPLKLTLLAPVNPLPVNVTVLPTAPEVGLKLLSVGAGGGVPDPTTLTLSSSVLAAVANPIPPLLKLLSVPEPTTAPLIEALIVVPCMLSASV